MRANGFVKNEQVQHSDLGLLDRADQQADQGASLSALLSQVFAVRVVLASMRRATARRRFRSAMSGLVLSRITFLAHSLCC
jgi:hypothetical protein